MGGMTTFREAVMPFYARIHGEVLPLGMGCATIGHKADAGVLRQFQEVLAAAYESGVRYFDTSIQYGGSEYRLGEFLRDVPRESVFLATKSPIPNALAPHEAYVHMRQAIHNALERLGVEQIDLYQVHDVVSLDSTLMDGGALEALLEAQEAGLIRYIGLGVRDHHLLRNAASHPDFDTVLTYRDFLPIHIPAAGLIAEAVGQGKAVINGSPLAFGLLTGGDPRQKTGLSAENQPLIPTAGRLYDLCEAHGWPLLGVALRFPMRNPDIAITLTGPGSPEEWSATLAALSVPIAEGGWKVIDALREDAESKT